MSILRLPLLLAMVASWTLLPELLSGGLDLTTLQTTMTTRASVAGRMCVRHYNYQFFLQIENFSIKTTRWVESAVFVATRMMDHGYTKHLVGSMLMGTL